MASLDRIFKAMADPTRLRILSLLLEQEHCVCELVAVLHLPQSLVSRHLAYLKTVGLVEDHRLGARVQYSAVFQSEFGPGLREFLEKALRQGGIRIEGTKGSGHEDQGVAVQLQGTMRVFPEERLQHSSIRD